ncbi:MAG: methionyl-tRNA formyltransferase [Limnobacter sp.]|nr:methionyl-tRNA formyltransferase [Limnobacter sp.]
MHTPFTALHIAFAGTPEFAAVALRAILQAGFSVGLVLTQPDRPAGRGMKLGPSPVKAVALEHRIATLQPESLRKGPLAEQALTALRTGAAGTPFNVLVVAAYGLILPQEVLNIPQHGCLNIHASLLPRWRGAAPIHRCLEAGDTHTGVDIMRMEAGLDTGPVCLEKRLAIAPTDTTATLHDALATLGGQAIVEALHTLQHGDLTGGLVFKPQAAEGITYAHKVLKAEAAINWQQPAQVLHRKLRAFDPFPGCHTLFNGSGSNGSGHQGELLKCFAPRLQSSAEAAAFAQTGRAAQAGQLLAVTPEGVWVQCADTPLLVQTLQRPGARRTPAQQVACALGMKPGLVLAGGQDA